MSGFGSPRSGGSASGGGSISSSGGGGEASASPVGDAERLVRFIDQHRNEGSSGSGSEIEALYTIIIYQQTVEEVLLALASMEDSAKNISNPKLREAIKTNLNALSNRLKPLKLDEVINSIFLVDKHAFEFEMSRAMVHVCATYNQRKFYHTTASSFDGEYLKDFFLNSNFIFHLKIDRGCLKVRKMTKHKFLDLPEAEPNKDFGELCAKLRGASKPLANIFVTSPPASAIYKALVASSEKQKLESIIFIEEPIDSNAKIWELNERESMKVNLSKLSKVFVDIANDKSRISLKNLVAYGKIPDFKDLMEQCALEVLFIEERKLSILQSKVEAEHFIPSLSIIPIRSLDPGDVGDLLIKSYNGLLGVKFF